jgi:hypothetical protein
MSLICCIELYISAEIQIPERLIFTPDQTMINTYRVVDYKIIRNLDQ